METRADPIHVVLGSNEGYAQHLAVAIVSILHNTKTPVVFHLLQDDLREEIIAKISACGAMGPAQFDFIPLRSQELFGDLPTSVRTSPMAYARLKIPTLLPQLARALYLDCDVVVCTDLAPLWQTDLSPYPIGACLDFVSPRSRRGRPIIDPRTYFNSGVMLLDLDAMRDMRFEDILAGQLTDQNRTFTDDQDLLNLVFLNNWKRLNSRWNVVTHHSRLRSRRLKLYEFEEYAEALKDPGIIHYTGSKPWLYLCDGPFKDRYWFYLAMTEFRDYRYPAPTLGQRALKWRRRLKRRAKELRSSVVQAVRNTL